MTAAFLAVSLCAVIRLRRKRETILGGGNTEVVGHREDDRIGQRAGVEGDAVVRAEGFVENRITDCSRIPIFRKISKWIDAILKADVI